MTNRPSHGHVDYTSKIVHILVHLQSVHLFLILTNHPLNEVRNFLGPHPPCVCSGMAQNAHTRFLQRCRFFFRTSFGLAEFSARRQPTQIAEANMSQQGLCDASL